MKKIGVLILCLILFVQVVYAEDVFGLEDKVEGIEGTKENIEGSLDKIEEEGIGSFVESWWRDSIENTEFFIAISRAYSKVSSFTDPIFEFLFGAVPFSFLFFLSLFLWILFFVYFYRILQHSFFSELVGLGISFLMMVIISVFKLTKLFAELIFDFVSLFGIWWIQLIVGFLFFVGIIFMIIFSKQVGEFFKGMKERRKKLKKELRDIETEAVKEDIRSFADALRRGISRE